MRTGDTFCPGILHAVPARDGLLMRIRVPGGLLTIAQLSAIAAVSETFADGQIEITSRANLQLRAIRRANLPAMVDALTTCGLLPSAQHDRVRNISTSPFAGIEADELIDSRPLVRTLDRQLSADTALAALPPKFNFGIYGGGALYSPEQDDFALHAVPQTRAFALYIGGVCTEYTVPFEHGVDCLLDLAKACLRLAVEHRCSARTRRFISVPGLLEKLLESVQPLLTLLPSTVPAPVLKTASPGLHPAAHTDRVNLIPTIPLGRLTSAQARRLADATEAAQADLRLAPWRGLVLGAVPREHVPAVVSQLEAADLWLDGRDGFTGLAACAGAAGCDAAQADVRGDASRLAYALAGRAMLPGWTANFAGCEKQCAMRHGASVELIGVPDGYLLRLGGQSLPHPASAETAIRMVLEAHAAGLSSQGSEQVAHL